MFASETVNLYVNFYDDSEIERTENSIDDSDDEENAELPNTNEDEQLVNELSENENNTQASTFQETDRVIIDDYLKCKNLNFETIVKTTTEPQIFFKTWNSMTIMSIVL